MNASFFHDMLGSIAERGPGEVGNVEVAGKARVVDDGTVADVTSDDASKQLHFDGASIEDAETVVVRSAHHRTGSQ